MGSRRSKDAFSHPENDARVKSAWEEFLSGEDLQSSALRSLIDDSWRRCLSEQVDPSRFRTAPPLQPERLAELRRRHARLMDASTPLMTQARDLLAQTGTVMTLADPDGTILDTEGDARLRDPLEEARLIPGGNWAEAVIGTNAIGTALALGEPVQVHAAEHFCEGIQRWTCSATIIRDPMDATILGAIDVSGLSGSYTRHSLALAVATADRIEARLARLETEGRFRLLDHCMPMLSAADPGGVLVFDRYGRLVKANEKAQAALAALGVAFRPGPAARILAFSAEDAGESELPEWLRPEWVRPILEGKDRLGTVVSVPLSRARTLRFAAPPDPVSASAFEHIVGPSAVLREALQRARQLARSQVSVLLLGETGVGKELFARGIHQAGAGSSGPFVALNCGGLSRDLLTSELFGYAEGAFTGARRGGMTGRIEAAHGGTLFLDEIGEMPLDLQPHFLRVLEQGEIYRVGENTPRRVTFRLIAATNRDLRSEVAQGAFRMDLFYRIAVTSLHIPPLRERSEDVRPIAEATLAALAERHGVDLPTVDEQALALLERYDWPGNVRELRNVIESALLMSAGGRISVADLPPEIRDASEKLAARGEPAGTLETAEAEQIRHAIRSSAGNLTAAARMLGIAKSTLYLKLKKYGMQDTLQGVRDR